MNNKEFWENKLEGNKLRDIYVTQTLENEGWKVIRIWEHELKNSASIAERINTLLNN